MIRHLKRKPDVWSDIQLHWHGCQPHECIVVGDRILSDVVMGNKLGMFTIRVAPFNTKNENVVVKAVRLFEDKILPLVVPPICRDKAP